MIPFFIIAADDEFLKANIYWHASENDDYAYTLNALFPLYSRPADDYYGQDFALNTRLYF